MTDTLRYNLLIIQQTQNVISLLLRPIPALQVDHHLRSMMGCQQILGRLFEESTGVVFRSRLIWLPSKT